MRFDIVLIVCLFLTAGCAHAQDVDSLTLYNDEVITKVRLADAAFSVVVPSGAFADQSSQRLYVGGSLVVLQQLYKEKPAFVGVELTYMHFGSLDRTYEILSGFDIIEVDGRMSSNTVGINLVGRYYAPVQFGPVQTFMELHIGGKWLYTYLSEVGVDLSGDNYSSTDFEESAVVPTYGGAAGLQVALVDQLYLLIKGSYQVATSGRYRLRIPDEINVFPLFPEDGFQLVRSSTNNIRFDLGLTFSF